MTRKSTICILCIFFSVLATAIVAHMYLEGFLYKRYWFDDIREPLSIDDSEAKILVQFAAASILDGKYREGDIPVILKRDKSPRIIFMSVSDGKVPAHVVMGAGKGLVRACKKAISEISDLRRDGYQPKWLKIDIVRDVHSMGIVEIEKPLKFKRSLEGLAFGRESGIAFLPEEVTAYNLVSKKKRIRKGNILNYLAAPYRKADQRREIQEENTVPLFRFTTLSFFTDGKEIVPLYRGHRLLKDISKEELLLGAKQAGEYLARAINHKGKFIYLYRPGRDDMPKKYNILRHAGTIYAMLELYETTGDKKILSLAKRAIDYLVETIKPCPGRSKNLSCVIEMGYTKLGGNALAAIALAKYSQVTGDRKYLPVLLELGRWIKSVQKENGEFFIHKQSYPDGRITDFVSRYYPGEALLALVRIYNLESKHEIFLDAAEKGAKYLINSYDNDLSVSDLSNAHWILYALNELYRNRPDSMYLGHVLRLADAIVKTQNRKPVYPDWMGSYYRPPRSAATAVRTEALGSAYFLARDFKFPDKAEKYLNAIKLGITYQLYTQFRPETVLYLKNPARCLGGFHHSLTNFNIRIDYIQHNLSGILALYRILNKP